MAGANVRQNEAYLSSQVHAPSKKAEGRATQWSWGGVAVEGGWELEFQQLAVHGDADGFGAG